MKIKLDENLPHRLGRLLNTLGHQVHTVSTIQRLIGRADYEIWKAAQEVS
jgi:predicted nuclease of predicted toxin-antitoxin system